MSPLLDFFSLTSLLLQHTFSLFYTSPSLYSLFSCVLQLPQQLIVFLSGPPCWSQLLRRTAATAFSRVVYPEYISCPLPQYTPTYLFLSFLEYRISLSPGPAFCLVQIRPLFVLAATTITTTTTLPAVTLNPASPIRHGEPANGQRASSSSPPLRTLEHQQNQSHPDHSG